MKYRDMAGEKISVLGFGCMRFPTIEKDGKRCINEELSAKMLRYAYENGVNYFDTAYVYHDGESEGFMGKAMQDFRDDVFIATKCPTWEVKKEEDFGRILDEQLARLRTDHIDFYLMHALDKHRLENIVLKFGLIEKLNRAKAEGKIRHIGFSFHDDFETFKRIVDLNPAWEFCQIQLNYINVEYQAGLAGLEYAHERGLGVVIMEPMLGGRLSVPNKFVREALDKKKTPVEWALNFLWNRPEVCITLSGMGAPEQVEENISYADSAEVGMLSDGDIAMLAEAKKVFDKYAFVPCTKCRYCMPCPFGLDIPKIFELYNASSSVPDIAPRYKALDTLADQCRKCHRCEKACPQGIKITEELQKAHKRFTA